jgi:RNA polymerase sigma-70 factor (ECF subfamily)
MAPGRERRPASADWIEAVYRQHGHSVLRRARRILGIEEEAMDVLQDVFASLMADPDQLRARPSVTSWLYGATTHLCLNLLRNGRNRERLLATGVLPVAQPEPAGEDWAAVRQMLARMPEELARVAAYHHFDGMSHAEIAGVLGCSRRTVGNILERVRLWAQAQERVA